MRRVLLTVLAVAQALEPAEPTLVPALALLPAPQLSLEQQARDTILRAARSFRALATEGGYLWRYSPDLKTRAGERPATATQVWIQPPGTPEVGQTFLRAWRATGEAWPLDAAVDAARCLVRGQLDSGGWDYLIEFDPALRDKWKAKGISTYDDDNTQSALRLLMDVHKARPDREIQAALDRGLQALLKIQYPNGAWPQRHPAPTEGYYGHYTFNDDTIADIVRTLIQAHEQFGDKRYLDAVRRAGDFIILAQLPAPQAAWAQQYDRDMKPAWARKFEPPSVCSRESAGVIRTLVRIHQETGDAKYLKPIPAAIDWFGRSQISPGRWARFYELGTNRPLYFTKKYELVYTDGDLPTHYAFQSNFGIPEAIGEYEQMGKPQPPAPRPSPERVRQIVAALDRDGRWVNNGWIEARTFNQNVRVLCDFLDRGQPR